MGMLLQGEDLIRVREFTGACSLQSLSEDMLVFVVNTEEAVVVKTCNMVFENRTITELYDGDGSDTLILENYPVSDISVLLVDGATILSTGYYLYRDKGMIRLKNGYFTAADSDHPGGIDDNYQNVSVTYDYGSVVIDDPERFNLAKSIAFNQVCKKVLLMLGNIVSGGISNEKMDEYSISFGSNGAYGNTILELNRQIEAAYKTLGVSVEARII